MSKSEWVEQVLESGKYVKAVNPSNDLWLSLNKELTVKKQVALFPSFWKYAAACVLVLFSLNVWLMINHSNASQSRVLDQVDISLIDGYNLYQE